MAPATTPDEVITRPQDLGLPPEAATVFKHLTPTGAEVFSQEILLALMEAQAKGNLRPVRDVVDAWFGTLQLRAHPDYKRVARWARRYHPKAGLPAEKLVDHFAT
jgi:hypothetical protein